MRASLGLLLTSGVVLFSCSGTGPDTGTGGGAGGGSVAARCSTANCAGCCDQSDVCQLGQAATACGTGGNACLACGAGLKCSAGGCAPDNVTPAKRVFVTSASFAGNLKVLGNAANGLAGGDALCSTAAAAAALGGTWKAWLSGGTTRAPDRITGTGPWVLVGTTTIVFNNKANLSTLALAPIDRNENGGFVGGVAWTGTATGGAAALDCSAWTTSSTCYSGCDGSTRGIAGDPSGGQQQGRAAWTEWAWQNCGDSNHLICFEL